jgi:hypothetical protein
MPITELYTGTEAVGTTEWSLTADSGSLGSITTDGIFQIWLDLSDMITADELQIRVYEKVRGADTQRIVYQSNLIGPQSPPIWVSPSLILMNGWEVTLDAIVGTVTVTWSIRQVS